MNSKEEQNKFNQKLNVKKSEYDRQNTNMLKHTNSIMKGKNLLPKDLSHSNSTSDGSLVLLIISIVFGILFFIYVLPLFEKLVSPAFYYSLSFLSIGITLSIVIVWIVNQLLSFFVKKIRNAIRSGL